MQAAYVLTGEKVKPMLMAEIEAYAAKISGKKSIPDAERVLAKSVISKTEGYTSEILANLMLARMDEFLPEICNQIPYARYMLREELALIEDEFDEIDTLISDYAVNELKSLQSRGLLEFQWFVSKWWPTAVESV